MRSEQIAAALGVNLVRDVLSINTDAFTNVACFMLTVEVSMLDFAFQRYGSLVC